MGLVGHFPRFSGLAAEQRYRGYSVVLLNG